MESTLRLNRSDWETPEVDLPRLCESLVCRTSPITKVVVKRIGLYTYHLGRALLQNSSVTSLCLTEYDLMHLWEDGSAYAVYPLLKYIATSQALTRVELSIRGCRYHRDLLDRLLHAAAKNSNIVEVAADYDICVPAEALTNFLTTTHSIRKLSVCIGCSAPNTREMLASAFGKTQTLQDLALSALESFDGGIVELILSELVASSSNLCTLRLRARNSETLSQLPTLACLLRSTQTLSHVSFEAFTLGQ
jgi:hypothetical protein